MQRQGNASNYGGKAPPRRPLLKYSTMVDTQQWLILNSGLYSTMVDTQQWLAPGVKVRRNFTKESAHLDELILNGSRLLILEVELVAVQVFSFLAPQGSALELTLQEEGKKN